MLIFDMHKTAISVVSPHAYHLLWLPTFFHSIERSFIHSFIHTYIHSFIHSFNRSFIKSNAEHIFYYIQMNSCEMPNNLHHEQGRIHSPSVADGYAGAVWQKNALILFWLPTDRRTDRPTNRRSKV